MLILNKENLQCLYVKDLFMQWVFIGIHSILFCLTELCVLQEYNLVIIDLQMTSLVYNIPNSRIK